MLKTVNFAHSWRAGGGIGIHAGLRSLFQKWIEGSSPSLPTKSAEKLKYMVFTIEQNTDKELDRMFVSSVRKLNRFFGLKWKHDLPRVFIMKDRRTIDALYEKKTERWIVGCNDKRYVFALDNASMEKESSHRKRSAKEYASLINHEMCHAFFNKLSGGVTKPKWLNEGVSIYVSGQIKFKPKKFMEFLEFFEQGGKGVYGEAGYAIKILVEKFGKAKLLKLIKELESAKNRKSFDAKFKKIYGFTPTYRNFNKLLV